MTGVVLILSCGVLFYILTCIALFDIIRKDFSEIYIKFLWGGLVVLIPFLGCVLYFVFGAKKGKKRQPLT